ncbi:MAG: hypothetical protein ABQ298_02445 [Puniceicoccaceae bacterium]
MKEKIGIIGVVFVLLVTFPVSIHATPAGAVDDAVKSAVRKSDDIPSKPVKQVFSQNASNLAKSGSSIGQRIELNLARNAEETARIHGSPTIGRQKQVAQDVLKKNKNLTPPPPVSTQADVAQATNRVDEIKKSKTPNLDQKTKSEIGATERKAKQDAATQQQRQLDLENQKRFDDQRKLNEEALDNKVKDNELFQKKQAEQKRFREQKRADEAAFTKKKEAEEKHFIVQKEKQKRLTEKRKQDADALEQKQREAEKIRRDKVDGIMQQIDQSGAKVQVNGTTKSIIVSKGDKQIRLDATPERSHNDKPHFHFQEGRTTGNLKDIGEHRRYFKENE